MYAEAVDDEKLRLLAFEDRWHFVAILCLKCSGVIDEDNSDLMRRKVAVKLGLDLRELGEVARRLAEVGLIDAESLQPLAWAERQYESDSAAERMRRYREKKREQKQRSDTSERNRYVTVTCQDTDTDTDTEKKPPLSPLPKKREAWTPPEWVNPQAWADFEQHRREMRKPLSDLARTKAANQLQGMTAQQQQACIDASIQARWSGIFPDKHRGNCDASRKDVRAEGRTERAIRIQQELEERARQSWANEGGMD
jgi:hypothetical protein